MSSSLHDLLNQTREMEKAASASSNLEKVAAELVEAEMAFEKIATATGLTSDQVTKVAVALHGVPLTKEARDKLALEFDASGRFMARGFHDESIKLASQWDAHVKSAMEGHVAGQIENDLEAAKTPIPTIGGTPKQENANIAQGAAPTTEAGKVTEVDTRLPGGEIGKQMTVRDALGLPMQADTTAPAS